MYRDPFMMADNVTNRLFEEHRKHGYLIVAFDFDNTVFDYYKKGYKFMDVISLLQRCKELGFYLIVYSCNGNEKYCEMTKYLYENNIPFDVINENHPKINFGFNKLYYNILLDDRAGLESAYESLNHVVTILEAHKKNKNEEEK